jgi:integrase
MSIKQRGKRGILWVEFTAPSGERVRRSAKTTDPVAAQEYHDKLKAESWRRDVIGQKPRPTYAEAAVSFLKAKKERASKDEMARHIEFWRGHFGKDRVDAIRRTKVAEIVELEFPGNATRNRYVATLRAMLRLAEANDEDTDYRAPKFKKYEESDGREVWLKPEDFWRLHAALPEGLKAPAMFAVNVGMREGNLMELEWGWIDLQEQVVTVPGSKTKNRKPETKHLNRRAIEVLKRQLGKDLIQVFPQFWTDPEGNRRTSPQFLLWGWRKALQAIQGEGWYQGLLRKYAVPRLRWHDLRHTFASFIGQQNGGGRVVQQAGSWESEEMASRYTHFGMEHLAPYFEGIADRLDTGSPQEEVAQK